MVEQWRKKDIYILVFGAVLLHWGLNYLDRIGYVISFVFGVISPFLLGIGIAFLFNLPMRAIERVIVFMGEKSHIPQAAIAKIKRPLGIVLTLASAVILLSGIVAVIVPKMTETMAVLKMQIPTILESLQIGDSHSVILKEILQWLRILGLDIAEFSTMLANGMEWIGNLVLEHSLGMITAVFDKAVAFGIAFVFAIYILSGKEKLIKHITMILKTFFSEKAVQGITSKVSLIDQTFSSFFRGQCLEACILGMMFFAGMTILRFPHAMVISVLVSITALIPIFGAFIACVIGAFLMLVESPILAVWFVLFFLVMQQIEGNLIYPYVMGSRVGLPSVWVLAAVTIGGTLFGILGMILFIPIVSIIYTLCGEFLSKKQAEKEQYLKSESR